MSTVIDIEDHENQMLGLYGSYINVSRVCAICHRHGGVALNYNNVRNRECLKKNCHYLEKIEHPIWDQRANEKKKKQTKKQRLEAQYNAIVNNHGST